VPGAPFLFFFASRAASILAFTSSFLSDMV
jgi:hypothetical protein